MASKPDSFMNSQDKRLPEIEAAKLRRQQQREQTLAWISSNALSTLRHAWHRA